MHAAVEKTVMQAAGLSLPEFNGAGNHPVTAPEIRQGDFALKEFLPGLFKFLQEQLPQEPIRLGTQATWNSIKDTY